MDVQGRPSYPSLFQRLGQSFLVDQAAPGRVDEESSLTHLCSRGGNGVNELEKGKPGEFLE